LIEFIARMFTSPHPPQTKAKADSFIRVAHRRAADPR